MAELDRSAQQENHEELRKILGMETLIVQVKWSSKTEVEPTQDQNIESDIWDPEKDQEEAMKWLGKKHQETV